MGVGMDDRKMAKYAALGGIVFVALNIVGTALMGSPPKPNDSNTKIMNWFVDKESGIKTAGFLGALSIIFMLWFMGTLWRHMATAEGGNHRLSVVSIGGLIGGGVAFMSGTAIQSSVALRIKELQEGGVGFFYLMSSVFLGVAGAFIGTHLLATNLLALRTKWLPSWHAGIGILAGLGFVVSSAGVMTDSGGIMIIGFISFLVWAVWIILTAVTMYRAAD
jgi:hypothetical protein